MSQMNSNVFFHYKFVDMRSYACSIARKSAGHSRPQTDLAPAAIANRIPPRQRKPASETVQRLISMGSSHALAPQHAHSRQQSGQIIAPRSDSPSAGSCVGGAATRRRRRQSACQLHPSAITAELHCDGCSCWGRRRARGAAVGKGATAAIGVSTRN